MANADKPDRVEPGEDEDVLARWSRRKLQARSGGVDPELEQAATSPPSEERDASGAEPAPQLTDADMPPLDSLTEDSDYAAFLSPGVSDDLRRQALRKLFGQQTFNVTDGLNDYDGDYTQFAGLGNVVTREMQRMLRHELETRLVREQPQPDATAAPQAGHSAADTITTGDAGGGRSSEDSVAAASDGPEADDTGSVDKAT